VSGATFVGMAGGDGTIRSGAQPLLGTGVPLPAGTRNHFARQLGIAELEDAVRAAQGHIEAVDVGDVNGNCFINNSAVGTYPQLVERREALQHRGLAKRTAQLMADVAELVRGHRFYVTMDGVRYRAWMIFVEWPPWRGHVRPGCARVPEPTRPGRSTRPRRPLLGPDPHRRLPRPRPLHRSPLVVQRIVPTVTFDFDTATVDVALDGEIVRVAAPLHYQSRAGELSVFIQQGTEHADPSLLI